MLCAVFCWLLAFLVPVLLSVVDGLVVDDLIFSCTVEAFGGLVFGLAEASFGAKLNGVGVGAVPLPCLDWGGILLNIIL